MSQSAGTSSVLATDSQFEIKRYGNSGIHTVEGNVAGPRAARLTKAREAEQKEHDKKRKAIEKQHRGNKVLRVDDKFNSQTDTSTSKFIERTTGLVSAEDFKKIQSELMEGETDEMIQAREERKERKRQRKKLEKKKKKEKARSQLSFGEDLVEVFDEENAEMPGS
jgi:protein FAM50